PQLELEQAALAHRAGDEETCKKLVASAMKAITATAEKEGKDGALNDYPLAVRLKVGKQMGKLDEAIDEIGALMDKAKTGAAPSPLRYERAGPRDREAVALAWQFLRDKQKDTDPSETLKLLRDWFVNNKADKDFEDTMASAKKWEGAGKDHAADWQVAQA